MSEVCERLSWDSNFFGVNIAKVVGDRLDPAVAGKIDRWCLPNRVDCLYFFACSDDAQTSRTAEDSGYRLVDVRVVFQKMINPGTVIPHSTGEAEIPVSTFPKDLRLSKATPKDIPELRRIAREAHRDTRFFFDPQFTSAQAEALYEQWIENSVMGYAEGVFVLESAAKPWGYVTCHLKDRTGSIGLIALDAVHRGWGLGPLMFNAAVTWLASLGATRVEVATSFRNLPAQRLYQRCGFVSASTRLIYHKWFARS